MVNKDITAIIAKCNKERVLSEHDKMYWEDTILRSNLGEDNYIEMIKNSKTEHKEGLSYDEGKEALDLIPPELLFALGEILRIGREKYLAEGGERNWEKGMRWGKSFGSLQRHLWKWWRGDPCDPENGKSHLYGALARLAFLLTYEERRIGTDDRPKRKSSSSE